jgi:hypothetical protein
MIFTCAPEKKLTDSADGASVTAFLSQRRQTNERIDNRFRNEPLNHNVWVIEHLKKAFIVYKSHPDRHFFFSFMMIATLINLSKLNFFFPLSESSV